MADNYQQRGAPVRALWNVFDFSKFRMSGKPWNEGDRKTTPSLSVHVINGNPRFRCYFNNGSNNSAIPVAFEPDGFFALLEEIKRIADNPEPDKTTIKIRAQFERGVRLEKPIVTVLLTVGRDNDGYVYIAIQPKGMEMAIFPFKSSYFAEFHGSNGEVLDPKICSSSFAKGWATRLQGMITSWWSNRFNEDPNAKKDRGPNSEYAKQYPAQKVTNDDFGNDINAGGKSTQSKGDWDNGFDDDVSF